METIKLVFNSNKYSILLIFFTKIIFLLNYYFVDDAYIIFRTAYNFGNFGEYSYNIGENFSGITSWLYGLWVSFNSLLFKDNFIFMVTVINTILSLLSSILIYRIFLDIGNYNNNSNKLPFLLIIFLNPTICSVSTIGLETSFLIFFTSLFFFCFYFSKNNLILFFAGIFIILTRIEFFSLILVFIFVSMFKKEKNLIILFSILTFGILFNFSGNYLINGYFLPETAVSKLHTITPSDNFNLSQILGRFSKLLLFDQSYFLGFKSKFFPTYFNALTSLLFLYVISKILFKNFKLILNLKKISHKESLLFAISISVIGIPAAYIISGQIWDWYFMPLSFFSYFILSCFLYKFVKNFIIEKLLLIIFLFLVSTNFLIKYNVSFQEHQYRSSVGKLIKSISKKSDTLFLEPAGFIPFYAQIRTIDTVGLSSKTIRKYRTNDNEDWWFDYVKAEKPDFIVDRKNILDGTSKDGYLQFSPNQSVWINKNYELVDEFIYQEFLNNFNFKNKLKKFIINLGSHSDYYVFKKI
tara:strand:+ start:8147 stop:9721 length:1575 start_codon:yes stop_codon:yes gene_type:complete